MVLKQKRTNTDVLIVDASKGYIKEGKNNKLRASDIKKIVDVVTRRESVDKYSRVVSRDEIRENDYNLNIPRYVDSSEAAESWDILRLCSAVYRHLKLMNSKNIGQLSRHFALICLKIHLPNIANS